MALVTNAVTLQGFQLNISFRPTGSGTFRYAVCQSAVTIKNTTSTNTVDTNCGPLTAVAIAPRFTGTVNLVFNSNADKTIDLSVNDLYTYQNSATLLDFQLESPTSVSAGATYLRQGQCYITDISESMDPDNFVTAAITFTGNGVITATGA